MGTESQVINGQVDSHTVRTVRSKFVFNTPSDQSRDREDRRQPLDRMGVSFHDPQRTGGRLLQPSGRRKTSFRDPSGRGRGWKERRQSLEGTSTSFDNPSCKRTRW